VNVFGDFASDREVILNEDVAEYNANVQLGVLVLWKNETCRRLIAAKLPVLADSPQLQDAMTVPLRTIIEFGGGLLNEDEWNELDRELRDVPVRRNEQ